jgi:hypothetical protein
MGKVQIFVVQAFEDTPRGLLVGQAVAAQTRDHADRLARRAAQRGGAIAFSREGDPQLGEWEDAEVIGIYGLVPEDAAEVAAAAA